MEALPQLPVIKLTFSFLDWPTICGITCTNESNYPICLLVIIGGIGGKTHEEDREGCDQKEWNEGK